MLKFLLKFIFYMNFEFGLHNKFKFYKEFVEKEIKIYLNYKS